MLFKSGLQQCPARLLLDQYFELGFEMIGMQAKNRSRSPWLIDHLNDV